MGADEDGVKPVSFLNLFRFGSATEKWLTVVGVLMQTISAFVLPAAIILFGRISGTLVRRELQAKGTPCPDQGLELEVSSHIRSSPVVLGSDNTACSDPDFVFMDEITFYAAGLAAVGLLSLIADWAGISILNYSAACQVEHLRRLFFRSVLSQEIGWYDTHKTEDFAVKLTDHLDKIHDGIGEKIGMFVTLFLNGVLCIGVAFYYGWELTLVSVSLMPVLVLVMAAMTKVQASFIQKELETYGKAGAIAEEALTSIKTVAAFGGEKKEVERFEAKLDDAQKSSIRRGVFLAIQKAMLPLTIFSSYGLLFWYGVKLIMDGRMACLSDPEQCPPKYDFATLIIVSLCFTFGTINIGQSVPFLMAFSLAKSAAATIFPILERVPEIDSSGEKGVRPKTGSLGDIVFSDVHFNYPSRPDVQVLQGLDLTVRKGEVVALVGQSGCGKSTILQLLQRFYDPASGSLSVDGVDVKDINVKWLRERIGTVSQEPVVFDGTIGENVMMGGDNTTMEDVIKACHLANAHEFIRELPQGYDTMVGGQGSQLSGGQKQRIAIARALIRNPDVLLLDEATSALDTKSESVVQKALEQCMAGRTTFVVAHRLSTIRNVDRIVVLRDGQVAEMGTHNDLIRDKGLYHKLAEPSKDYDGQTFVKDNKEEDDYKDGTSWSHNISFGSFKQMDGEIKKEEDESTKSSHQMRDIIQSAKLLKIRTKDWVYILLGLISSACFGVARPLVALVYGGIIASLVEPSGDSGSTSVPTSVYFVVIAVAMAVFTTLKGIFFSIGGANITRHLRSLTFENMLKQDMGWFDQPENIPGALCARLSTDGVAVQQVFGEGLGSLASAIPITIVGVVLGVYFDWRLGLVGTLFIPFLLYGTTAQIKFVQYGTRDARSFEKATGIAREAMTNIRTVAGLQLETSFHKRFTQALSTSSKLLKRKAQINGFIFGFSRAILVFVLSTLSYYGGYLIETERSTAETCFIVIQAMSLPMFAAGDAIANAPDFQKVKVAIDRLIDVMLRKPMVDPNDNSGHKLERLEGMIRFRHVGFSYPTRREVEVLRDLNLVVEKGQQVALVGPSGCGKSTCIQLLQRLYNMDHGMIEMDGHAIDSIRVASLRSRIGIVSQEPVLFNRSIAENIMYGDNGRNVTMDEVIEASRKANIHSFIASLPQGYETEVGLKGSQLSGGQKQRIAIARALVRNPDLLLLDEATSALDTESEKVVQEALNKAQEGRTSITIAHRLSTIQSADTIYVLSNGKVAESGTHNELVGRGGMYAELWSSQEGKGSYNDASQ